MRKYFEILTASVMAVLSMQEVSFAQPRHGDRESRGPRATRVVTRLRLPWANETEPAFEYDHISGDEETDRFLLTGVDDPVPPLPEPR